MQLLSPNVQAIIPPAHPAQRDHAPDGLAAGAPAKLRDELIELLGADRVLSRPIDLIRYATDASPYRLFPKVVVIARNVEDVRTVLVYARQSRESVTFRAAGTSLSGQAQGDGILLDVRRHWAGVRVEAGGGVCAYDPALFCRAQTWRCLRTATGSVPILRAHQPAQSAG